jgi:hypothetical protein
MDELDEFLESLGEDVATSPSRVEEADLEAEFEELFKQSESSNPQVDDLGGEDDDDDDDDDEEFTLTGGGNLGPLHANPQASPQFQKTPVKALVEKFNNPSEKGEKEKQLLSPEEKPKAKQVDLVPALQERNSDFKVRNPEEMKSYDGSNVGKILNSSAETSDAEFLSWLSDSAGGDSNGNNKNRNGGTAAAAAAAAAVPSRERVTKSALDYIQNIAAEEGGGNAARRGSNSNISEQQRSGSGGPTRMPLATGLTVDVDGAPAARPRLGSDDRGGAGSATPALSGHSPASIKHFFDEMFGDDYQDAAAAGAGAGDSDMVGGTNAGGGGGGGVSPKKVHYSDSDHRQQQQQPQQPRKARGYFPSSPREGSASALSSPGGSDGSNNSQSNSNVNKSTQDLAVAYEEDVADIVRSPFPRVEDLKNALREGGYVPPRLRGAVWCLLLTGTVTEDHEVAFFQPTGKELQEGAAKSLANDCDAIIKRFAAAASASTSATSSSSIHLGQTRSSVYDLLVLYCSRKKIDYNPVYAHLLAPMLCLEQHALSRPQASSCFQALAEDFVPFFKGLRTEMALGHAVNKVHSWTRLLLTYHAPALAQHLDRVLPGWERAARGVSSAESEQRQSRFDLDALEQAYGLADNSSSKSKSKSNDSAASDSEPPQSPSTAAAAAAASSSSEGLIASASPQHLRDGGSGEGCIPLHWICGMFTGCAPPEQAVLLLDWAIVNQERYAGVYLLVALFEIFSAFLVHMDGAQITAWLEEVSHGGTEWFKSTSLPRCAYGRPQQQQQQQQEEDQPPTIGQHAFQQNLTWPVFLEGWIGAAGALRRATPRAFRDAITDTEKWAGAEFGFGGSRSDSSEHGHSRYNRADLFDFGVTSPGKASPRDSTINNNQTEQQQLLQQDGGVGVQGPNDYQDKQQGQGIEGAKTQFLSMSRRISAFAMEKSAQIRERSESMRGTTSGTTTISTADSPRPDGGDNDSPSLSDGATATASGAENMSSSSSPRWPHQVHAEANTICLWSSAQESIPCICTSRRLVPVPSVLSQYETAVAASSYNPGSLTSRDSTYPLPTVLSARDSDAPQAESIYDSGPASAVDKPFFFGIDCRTEAERLLGCFPKAIGVDPSFITDPSSIADILAMLEPLAQSVHLCIIGSGEEYIRYMFRQQRLRQQSNQTVGGAFAQLSALGRGIMGGSDAESEIQLESLLREYRIKLNTIAMFFLKRAFMHVSILDGGFIEAVRELKKRPATPVSAGSSGVPPPGGWGPYSSVLVDFNGPMLDRILNGQHVTEASDGSGSYQWQSKAQAAAAAVKARLSTTTTQLHSLTKSNPILGGGEARAGQSADGDAGGMDSKQHGTESAEELARNLNQTSRSSQDGEGDETSNRSRTGSASSTGSEGGGGGGGRYSTGSAGTDTANNTRAAAAAQQAKSLFGEVGKRFSVFGATVQTFASEKVAEINSAVVATSRDRSGSTTSNGSGTSTGGGRRRAGSNMSNNSSNHGSGSSTGAAGKNSAPSFTIEDTDDNMSSPGASRERTKEELALAMANHAMAGLKKGDTIPISRDALPGALLFPCTKMKKVKKESKTAEDGEEEDKEVVVNRFLVVSRERLLVLDSHGQGLGANATVKSNHHLTQLIKMTFRKKDPNLVHLFFATGDTMTTVPPPAPFSTTAAAAAAAEGDKEEGEDAVPVPVLKEKSYRLTKTKQFVLALQNGMKRFK